jgi:1-deoxy-D-xylulose-5-phosphate reductoisomerase
LKVTAVTILGSTGSIGTNALKIVAMFPDRFRVAALTARSNIDLLVHQIKRFKPEMAVVGDEKHVAQVKRLLPGDSGVTILHGSDGYMAAASLKSCDVVLGAMVGAAGLKPILAAIEARKTIALANKETLVMAGQIVMDRIRSTGVRLLPVDSEHSAIFQSLEGNRREDLLRVLLTASGGPFLNRPREEFNTITPRDALKHPNWSMGSKITIDSATMMNKGLEVIEAKWLFDLRLDEIEVVVHPQSIVHSMVAYCDGSVIAQMGVPDMRGAIAYALSHPRRLPIDQPLPAFTKLGQLTFEAPDLERFPCLGLAFAALEKGGGAPAVLNAANEVAVAAFLDAKISFVAIPELIEGALENYPAQAADLDLAAILEADQWARNWTKAAIQVMEAT